MLRSARERSLPVYIEFPRDLVNEAASAVPVLPYRPADPEALKPRARSIERLPEKGSGLSRPDTPIDSEVRSQSSCLGINVFSIRLSCPAGASWSRCAMPVPVANLIQLGNQSRIGR